MGHYASMCHTSYYRMKGQKGKKVNQLNAENDNEYAFAVKGDAKHYVTMQSTYKLVALQSI